ncbi:hypothetical protein EON63_17845 [archaeon]|nr:MAG: hypothetical protein EON63_17845 [archaeon]
MRYTNHTPYIIDLLVLRPIYEYSLVQCAVFMHIHGRHMLLANLVIVFHKACAWYGYEYGDRYEYGNDYGYAMGMYLLVAVARCS